MAKIKGLKKAVGDYQRFNAGGPFDAHYGVMMYDTEDGKIWTDEFWSIGHNTWNEYHSDTIYCVSQMMREWGWADTAGRTEITMASVKAFIEECFGEGGFRNDL